MRPKEIREHEWISAWRFDLTLRRYQAGLRLPPVRPGSWQSSANNLRSNSEKHVHARRWNGRSLTDPAKWSRNISAIFSQGGEW